MSKEYRMSEAHKTTTGGDAGGDPRGCNSARLCEEEIGFLATLTGTLFHSSTLITAVVGCQS